MEKIKPLFIVMTPVRNEAWVLHAFLKTTSTWADFIIIADQMSTDGSRDIYKQYEKVIVIDNNNQDFNEAERQSMQHRSVISLSRNYRYQKKLEEYPIDENCLNYGKQINVLNEVDTTSKKFWFDEYILERNSSDLKKIAKLDIWDNDFIETYNLKDPRNIWIKLLHQYLRKTQKYKSTILVRAIDKVLKIMV
jgi:hypothetical protein